MNKMKLERFLFYCSYMEEIKSLFDLISATFLLST